MVLEGIEPPPDSFSDNPYPSEDDAYAGSSSGSGSFDASTLSKPIPILGPLLGFTAGSIRFKTESTIKFAELRIKRQLTYDEAHALAGHLYDLESKKSYYTALGAGLGSWRWYKTFSTGRFPLHQPTDVDPNKFFFVKGPMAFYARHSCRLALYVFVAGEFGKLLGQIIAQPVAAHDTANDPRLERFTADLKAAVERGKAEGAGGLREQLSQQVRAARETSKAVSGGQAPVRRSGETAPSFDSSTDDMSPTAGNESWPSSPESSWDSSSASNSGSIQKQSRQSQQSWSSRKPSPQTNADDASPTSGFFQDEVESQSRPGESAWDRLRRGANPPGGQQRPAPPRREKREDPNLGDSFTFADSDEERKRAQERAQREFDERIERERQGRGFDEEGKRW